MINLLTKAKYQYALVLIIPFLVFISGCSNEENQSHQTVDIPAKPVRGDWAIVALRNEPASLNPSNYIDEISENIAHHIYQSLLDRSQHDNFDLIPKLAKERPYISQDGLELTFEIRPEAKWDNGSDITAQDVLFSLKVFKNPHVNCSSRRAYIELVKDLKIDPVNPRKFTVILKEKYILAENSIGQELIIFPAYSYDSTGILSKYTIPQIDAPSALNDPALKLFAERHNSPRLDRDKNCIVGSGPYRLVSWQTDQKLILERKKNWWADSLYDQEALEAFPDKIIFKIIKDENSAIAALKAGEIDVLTHITPKNFIELEKNQNILKNYHLSAEPTFAYTYFGMNCKPAGNRKPFFTDKRVRRAMAHCLNADEIIKQILFGLSERVVGPVLPQHKRSYNDSLKPIPFSIAMAQQLLDEAGWKDTDNDGIRDKIINGVKIPFEFEFDVSNSIEIRKNIGLIYQENLKKAGVRLILRPLDHNNFFAKQKARDFDMYYGGWVASPAPQDLKQIFHTSAFISEGGSNDVGFGNPESDRIIDAIRIELNDDKRNALYRKFQEIIYDEQPYVFFITSQTPVIISNRFQNSHASGLRPNYQANGFWTPPSLKKYK